jgi:hypothetical protein
MHGDMGVRFFTIVDSVRVVNHASNPSGIYCGTGAGEMYKAHFLYPFWVAGVSGAAIIATN